VELAVLPSRQPGCPACAGRRFGFIADLSEAQVSMCPAHRAEADAVTRRRLARAGRSNPAGWAALVNATIRRELPHLPNGLAIKLAGAEQAMYVQPERDELAERAQLVIEAAGWFPGNARDFGIALGEDPDRALGFPDWLANLVADLGRAGLPDDAIAVGNALARVDPGAVPVIESDIAEALARADWADEARARTELNLTRWPDDTTVRMRAGECLAILGDLDGAAVQFEAALELADAADDFEARADAAGELRRIERRRARESGGGRPGAAGQRRQQPSRASRSRRRRQH
jgi:tetratricopeptide (TPR) repeat protein